MISPIATVVAQRGRRALSPRGLLVHVTGSGLIDAARKARIDPEEFAVAHYAHRAPYYPHYLIAPDGDTYAFCDELKRAAHAAWRSWEVRVYAESSATAPSWRTRWARDFLDGVIAVAPGFYAAWDARWGGRGLGYDSPHDLLTQVGATASTPNSAYIGVECLASTNQLADAQLDALAALFVDCARRNEWIHPGSIDPASLPQAWLCGHSDVSPCRRYQRTRADRAAGRKVPRAGFPFDPPGRVLDWADLGRRILTAASL